MKRTRDAGVPLDLKKLAGALPRAVALDLQEFIHGARDAEWSRVTAAATAGKLDRAAHRSLEQGADALAGRIHGGLLFSSAGSRGVRGRAGQFFV